MQPQTVINVTDFVVVVFLLVISMGYTWEDSAGAIQGKSREMLGP